MISLSGARRHGILRLRAAGIERAEPEADLLLIEATGLSRTGLLVSLSRPIPRDQHEVYLKLLDRRCSREPLQYILGSWEFYGHPLKVRPGVLIPRQDTEILIDIALPLIRPGDSFLDWGSGSGCITLAMLSEKPGLRAVAADANPQAVSLTWSNLAAAGLLRQCLIWHSRRPQDIPVRDGELSMIISNPPYIPSGALEGLMEEVRAEPLLALDGGEDGLDWYRKIFSWGAAKIRPGGWILFEIGDGSQGEKLAEIAPRDLRFRGVFNDLTEKPRAALWLRV